MKHTPVHITLDITPPTATAQQKGVCIIGGKPRFFEKSRQKDAHQFLAAMLLPHVPKNPFEKAVYVSVRWCYPFRKTESKIARVLGECWHDTRPDLENLEKGLLDLMTRMGFWTDDSLIARKFTEKRRGETPRLEIDVEEL